MTTVLESLNYSLHQALARDERVYILGEDILDPYGGAFKVTRGLSRTFPGRVLTTPISEAGIVGTAAGMALRGLRPVVEIMFGDFLTLAADQIVNHAAKFRWMYNDQVRVPLVIRTPMGGRRGYGPTHSQTLEKLFFGVPGLRILAPNAIGDPGALLLQAILLDDDPVLFIENKLLYACPVALGQTTGPSWMEDFEIQTVPRMPGTNPLGTVDQPGASPKEYAPSFYLKIRGAPPASLTIATYGYMAEIARQAAIRLAFESEIFSEMIVMSQLIPMDITPVLESVSRTTRLLILEEGTLTAGWSAEVAAQLLERPGGKIHSFRRVAALDLPIPASVALEDIVLPSEEVIVKTAQMMV